MNPILLSHDGIYKNDLLPEKNRQENMLIWPYQMNTLIYVSSNI